MMENLLGLELIKKSESWRDRKYLCPAGKWTIGWGHVILPGERFDEPIIQEIGEQLLQKDAEEAATGIVRYVTVPLNMYQAAALLSFVFNIGVGHFVTSTLLLRLNKGDYVRAADQFRRWVYGGGVILPGLVSRRKAEKELFLKKEEV